MSPPLRPDTESNPSFFYFVFLFIVDDTLLLISSIRYLHLLTEIIKLHL